MFLGSNHYKASLRVSICYIRATIEKRPEIGVHGAQCT